MKHWNWRLTENRINIYNCVFFPDWWCSFKFYFIIWGKNNKCKLDEFCWTRIYSWTINYIDCIVNLWCDFIVFVFLYMKYIMLPNIFFLSNLAILSAAVLAFPFNTPLVSILLVCLLLCTVIHAYRIQRSIWWFQFLFTIIIYTVYQNVVLVSHCMHTYMHGSIPEGKNPNLPFIILSWN